MKASNIDRTWALRRAMTGELMIIKSHTEKKALRNTTLPVKSFFPASSTALALKLPARSVSQ